MREQSNVWCVLAVVSACATVEPAEPADPAESVMPAVAVMPAQPRARAIEPLPTVVVPPAADVVAAPVTEQDLRPLLGEIEKSYKRWALVDEVPAIAGADCVGPTPGAVHESGPDRAAAHADKQFLLYAADVHAYWRSAGIRREHMPERLNEVAHAGLLDLPIDVVQVVVKASFRHERDGEIGAPTGLFVMAKFANERPGTDEGWIYGTIAPSGKVTQAGSIAKCMGCHAKQPDRMFGLPPRS
jgi:hypothetical protein